MYFLYDSVLLVIKCRIYALFRIYVAFMHFFAKLCTAGAMVVDKYVRWVGKVDG